MPKIDPEEAETPEAASVSTPTKHEEQDGPSTYTCQPLLMSMLEKLAANVWENSLCKLAAAAVPGRTLDLSADGGQYVREGMTASAEAYKKDFPERLTGPTGVITHNSPGPSPGASLDVISEVIIDGDDDYRQKLAAHNSEAEAHELREVRTFLETRIMYVTDELGSDQLAGKLKRLGAEAKRKLYVYDASLDGDSLYSLSKKRKTNVHAGTGPSLAEARLQAAVFVACFLIRTGAQLLAAGMRLK